MSNLARALEGTNEELQCKIQKITEMIYERFDGDGKDDLDIPKKLDVWWILRNVNTVRKLIEGVISVIKTKCIQDA